MLDDEVVELERVFVALVQQQLAPLGHRHDIQQPKLAPALHRPTVKAFLLQGVGRTRLYGFSFIVYGLSFLVYGLSFMVAGLFRCRV